MIDESRISMAVKDLFADISFTCEPAGLYDPLRYMIEIGGKRIRPALCLTVYGLFHDSLPPEILETASALEVFHSFTLIHDDIMDNADVRRGMPTVWKKWNRDTAILSGDVMSIESYRRVAKAPSKVLPKVLGLFTDTAAQVCDGQQYDMDFEALDEVGMDRYTMMIGLKTAVLLACSAKMGAILAGCPDEVCESFYRYGYALGLAFQIADDYLDSFGDEAVFGKKIGGDIVNNKKSWLYNKALLSCADEAGKAEFRAAMALPSGTEDEARRKIEAVKEIYVRLGVDRAAAGEIERLHAEAMAELGKAGLGFLQTEQMRRFAQRLTGRVK